MTILITLVLLDRALRTRAKLHLAFIDYKAALDGISRELLWAKLHARNLPNKLLRAIQQLYTATWVQVKIGSGGQLSRKIYMHSGLN